MPLDTTSTTIVTDKVTLDTVLYDNTSSVYNNQATTASNASYRKSLVWGAGTSHPINSFVPISTGGYYIIQPGATSSYESSTSYEHRTFSVTKFNADHSVDWQKTDDSWGYYFENTTLGSSQGLRSLECAADSNDNLIVCVVMPFSGNGAFGIISVATDGTTNYAKFHTYNKVYDAVAAANGTTPVSVDETHWDSGVKFHKDYTMGINIDSDDRVYFGLYTLNSAFTSAANCAYTPAVIKLDGTDGSFLDKMHPYDENADKDDSNTGIIGNIENDWGMTDSTMTGDSDGNVYILMNYFPQNRNDGTDPYQYRVLLFIAKYNSDFTLLWKSNIFENDPILGVEPGNENWGVAACISPKCAKVNSQGDLIFAYGLKNFKIENISGGDSNGGTIVAKINGSTGLATWAAQDSTKLPSSLQSNSEYNKNTVFFDESYYQLVIGNRGDVYVANQYRNSSSTTGWTSVVAGIDKDGDFLWGASAVPGSGYLANAYVSGATQQRVVGLYMDTDGYLHMLTAILASDTNSSFYTLSIMNVVNAERIEVQPLVTDLGTGTITKTQFLTSVRNRMDDINDVMTFTPSGYLSTLIPSPPESLTSDSVFVLPVKTGTRAYSVTNSVLSSIEANSGALYIPESAGNDITLSIDGSDVAFTLGTSSLTLNSTTYEIGDSVPLTDNYTLSIVAFGSLVGEINNTSSNTNEVCFAYGTPITTDQGVVPIQDLSPLVHTIRDMPVLAVTKTINKCHRVVRIPKDSMGHGIPSIDTVVSVNHRIFAQTANKKIAIRAINLIGRVPGVTLTRYPRRMLYNVVLPTHTYMNVNGMMVESLDPANPIAKAYMMSYLVNAGICSVQDARKALTATA